VGASACFVRPVQLVLYVPAQTARWLQEIFRIALMNKSQLLGGDVGIPGDRRAGSTARCTSRSQIC
jgi:hypothetical protein